jgi:hypothetical protein
MKLTTKTRVPMLQQAVYIVMLELAYIRLRIALRRINMCEAAMYTGNRNVAPSGRK